MVKFLPTAVAVFLGGCFCQTAEVPVEFSPRPFDTQQADAVRQKDLAILGDWQPGEEQLKFAEQLKLFNRQAAGEEAEDLFQQLTQRAGELLQQDGPEKFKKFSIWLAERFENALKKLFSICDASCARALCQGTQPVLPADVLEEYRSWCSDSVFHACRAGLLAASEKGLLTSAEAAFILRTAFKVRLSGLLPAERQPLDLMLSPEEKKLYFMWVAEKSKLASPERKMEAVSQLKRLDPAYPEALARGIIHYQAGHFDAAVADFEWVLKEKPGDKKLLSWLEQSKKKHKQHPPAAQEK